MILLCYIKNDGCNPAQWLDLEAKIIYSHIMISYTENLNANDFEKLHTMLQQTYWANTRSLDDILDSVANSIFVAAKDENGDLPGFARAVTDRATFSWICDVIVDPAVRGMGIGKGMTSRLLSHKHVKRTRKILVTKNAQGLYSKFDFQTHPFECMICYEKIAQG